MSESKKNRKDADTKGRYFFNLSIFSLYSIALSVYVILREYISWNIFMCLVVGGALLVSYGVAIFSKSHSVIQMVIVVCESINLLVIGFAVPTFNLYIPVMAAFLILVSLIGFKQFSTLINICSVILIVYHMTIVKDFKFSLTDEGMLNIFEVVNLFLISIMIHTWNYKRAQNIKKIEQVLEETNMAEAIKDDFIANISHELRTPLNTILGVSDMLIESDLDNELREKIRYISMAGRNLSTVVGNILDFSELLEGSIVVENEKYVFASTINDIVNTAVARLQSKNTEIVVDCAADIPAELYGDEKKIRRVITNIVDNAIKFTEEGYILLRFDYRKEEYGINLIIEVEDTGIGISEENMNTIFKEFSQLDSKRNRRNDGLGLGLSISKLLVDNLGGILSINSKLGKGTNVKIVIPQGVKNNNWIAKLDENEKKQLSVGIYHNLEKFVDSKTRDVYQETISRIISQMNVHIHVCGNLSELKRRLNIDEFTHIFIGENEYLEDKEFFDSISKKKDIVVLVSQKGDKEITNEHLHKLFKPFYILPIVSLVKGLFRERVRKLSDRKFKADAKALVVDDNIMNLMVAKAIIETYGIEVDICESGRDALVKLDDKTYDLVFLDHMMPEMDGVETLERIREKGGMYFKNLPIVALTANAAAGARERFIKVGFNDFMEKPIERSVLERVLQRMIIDQKLHYYDEDEEDLSVNDSAEKVKKETKVEEMPEKKEEKEIEKDVVKEKSKELMKEAVKEETKEVNKETKQQDESEEKTMEVNKDELVIGDLDIEKGIGYCGTLDIYISILSTTVDTMIKIEKQVEELFESEDWKNYTIVVHGIKSSMLSIGATKLSEMAKALEFAGKEDRIEYILENHAQMLDVFRKTLKDIRNHPLINKPEIEEEEEEYDVEEISQEDIKAYAEDFENAVFEFDEEKMLEILDNIEIYSYKGERLKPIVKQLKSKIEEADYMSASDSLMKLVGGE